MSNKARIRYKSESDRNEELNTSLFVDHMIAWVEKLRNSSKPTITISLARYKFNIQNWPYALCYQQSEFET